MTQDSILLVGAGGHARACIDVIEQEGHFVVKGLVGFPKEVGSVILNNPVLGTDEDWKRKPFTRQELNNFCIISPDMSEDEIKRRVKSVTFPNAPGAYIKIE